MRFFRSSRSLSNQFTIAVLVVAGAAVAVFLAFIAWSVSAVDDNSLTRQHLFATSALADGLAQLPVQQTSSTAWDEAVRRVNAGDAAWMSDNLTVWMETYFGHDEDYVLAPDGKPVQVGKGGKLVDLASVAADFETIRPLVAALRAKMQATSAGQADSTDAVTGLGTENVLMLEGGPAMVSVKPIVPNTPALTQAAGTEYLHVAVQNVDRTLIDGIAAKFALSDARVETAPQESFWWTSVPVLDNAGHPKGYVVWRRDRPGIALIEQASPAFAITGLIGLGLLGLMLRRLRRSSIQLQASQARAQFLAFHDTLTGLPNRALLEDRFDRALAQARRDNTKVALICLDLDRFKNINDTLGHPAGDALVRQVGCRLTAAVRDGDTVARLGGDEFAILQVSLRDEQEAERLAERLLKELAVPFDLAGDEAAITASIGIALSHGESSTRDDMLRKADIALYEAKSQGRARYQLFAGDMDDLVRQRRAIERDLRAALTAGDEIHVAYQPIFDTNGDQLLGAEALARWSHPVHGPLSPQLFVSIAEERGLIEPLGEYVLRQACSFAAAHDLPWIAVNVSPIQFRNEQFVERVAAILAETGLAPNRLQIEITEGVLLQSAGTADRLIAALRHKGILVALDDFGTGYSSMSYLRRYGVDKLKIDRSFIQELGVSADAEAIVSAMVSLGRALDMRVVAEGVETSEQRDQLSAIGCHELQGFLLSRPLPPPELAALLHRQGGLAGRAAHRTAAGSA